MKSAFTRSRTEKSSRSASSLAARNPNWIERSTPQTFYEGACLEALNGLCREQSAVFLDGHRGISTYFRGQSSDFCSDTCDSRNLTDPSGIHRRHTSFCSRWPLATI